ncbi:unnamed protein product [Rhizoctonia solani]|uniref:NFX1-type zinc finger-containing protein 1 n=1 Tax=Rhizoctonia solani TaxID=456999 RepID=A0A8H3BMR4_9AGAM|nr:unnamed protein product [Rhizoctonia solani]
MSVSPARELTQGNDNRNSSDTPAAPVANFPGLSNDQFSKVDLTLTPGQSFNSLKTYVEATFQFKTPDQVYRFLSILCTANSQNSSWTAKEGQVHLHELVKGNGILRLADAIRFPNETDRPWSFHRGYIPIFTIGCCINSGPSALYGLFHSNFPIIRNIVETNMRKFMAARSFNDGYQSSSGKTIFKVLFVTLFECVLFYAILYHDSLLTIALHYRYLMRFKEAPATNPGVRDFADQIVEWFDQWLAALGSNPPFQDECTSYDEAQREFIIENIRRDKERVLGITRRGQTVIMNDNGGNTRASYQLRSRTDAGLVATLERNFDFDGPGEFCETGPRHDNDHAEIELIRVAPTRDELLCEDEPYLPANFFEAPHFHEPGSPERLLDIQFRLLREELTAPIRLAVHLIVEDLKKLKSGTAPLSKILDARGGRYAAPATAQESIMFSVFTGITFKPLELSNRGISVGIGFDAPPGRARHEQPGLRGEYWEQVSKKRLMQDGLVALIWRDHIGNIDVHVGTVASSARDLVEQAKAEGGRERVSIRVSFFDAKANIRIIQALQNRHVNNDMRVLIEAPVFYEGIRPFLEALKREPQLLPFAQYLRLQSQEELSQTVIGPPLYSRTPGFSFELKYLFPPTAGVTSLRLNTQDPNSVADTRAQLLRSRLDPSQAEAVVDSLTREIALIQGPPGTGKSYTGLELIRVLIKNDLFPILLVAFTNHALDHMLNGILDAKITDKIVRLGSRFAMDERLAKYSLDTIEREEGRSRLGSSGRSAYRSMKELETQMTALMGDITSHKVPSVHIEQHISSAYPHHHGELFLHPPSWVRAIAPNPSDSQQGWERQGEQPKQDETILDFWLKGGDLKFLETQGRKGTKAKASTLISNANVFDALSSSGGNGGATATRQDFLEQFMHQHGLEGIPKIPKTSRAVDDLLKSPQVWRMSRGERISLHKAWSVEASYLTNDSQIKTFEEFRQSHNDAAATHKEVTEQIKAEILSRSHIVGCTTTGAAKLVSLLSGMGPKVMIVEEAGQVLEAHILASLVGSVEHVILIGDPLQLRPNINSYKLSMDNPKTGKIYRFDQSLMERLSTSGFPMSQIDVQRRMRPEISSLIRNTLYPKLQDNDRVLSYPNVRGMYKNMYFVSHSHKEVGGGEDSVSKHNSFEIDMIYDLVVHLLKQGLYNTPGNIVVLAAYLGQIPKLRQKLQKVVTIVVDERDAELLDQHTMDQEDTGTVQQVQLSKQVIIRILEGESLNRTNVGLSRAKHGLYIFGNAPDLAQGSGMWSDVLKELHSSECLGPKLPIACHRHPDYIRWIGKPGEIPIVSPNGAGVISHVEELFLAAIYVHLCVTPMTRIISQRSACYLVFDSARFHTHAIENVGSVRKA